MNSMCEREKRAIHARRREKSGIEIRPTLSLFMLMAQNK